MRIWLAIKQALEIVRERSIEIVWHCEAGTGVEADRAATVRAHRLRHGHHDLRRTLGHMVRDPNNMVLGDSDVELEAGGHTPLCVQCSPNPWREMGASGDHFRPVRPLNKTMSFVTVARAMARRLPSRDQAKSAIVWASVKCVS